MKRDKLLVAAIATLSFLSSTVATAQDDAFSRLKAFATHIVQFNNSCPQEKVFLHFDNEAYYLGETIWFSAYVVDAGTLLPIAKSRVLYVELLTPDGDIIASNKLKLVAGRCYGCLHLLGRTETFSEGFSNKVNVINALRSGFYEVRAYTREMQNFGEGAYFSRVFPIYDAPETDGDYSQMQFTTTVTKRSTDTRKASKKADNLNIEFYPEGGALVEGVESRVAFRATDAYGLPAKITDAMTIDGKEVAIEHEGMGSFTYTPTDDSERDVNVTYEGKSYKFKLPKAEKNGYAMQVDNMQSDSIHINIARNKALHKTAIGATLMCRGNLAYFDTLRWNGNKASFSIGKEKLLPGVQQITLFTEKGEILAERMLFVRNGNMPDNVKIAINSDKNSYKPFEKIKLEAKVTDKAGNPVETFMSLAVRDGDIDNGGHYSDNICTDLLLSSDLKGYIANPGYYFESDDEQHNKALDLLMMVQGWRRYKWQTMAGVKPFKITNYLEDGISIDGEVLALSHNKPLKDIQVYMRATSPDGTLVQNQNVTTNEKGEFNFKLEEFYGDWFLTLSLSKDNEKLDKDARIKINRAPMEHVRIYSQWETNTPKPIVYHNTTTAALDKATQVEDFLVLPGVTVKEEKDLLDCEVYYIRDEAEKFLDQGELMGNIAGYFPKKAPKFFSNVAADANEMTDPDRLYYKNLEVTIIPMRTDGSVWGSTIPQTHGGNMALLDLDDIEYILFFNNPFAHTHLRISHKNMDSTTPFLSASNADRRYMMLVYPRKRATVPYKIKGHRSTYIEGFSTVKEFFAPEYNNAPLPGETDYRRTLYWNPLLRTDATGTAKAEFYNNGRCHIIKCDAATITPKGKIGSGKARIAPKK